MNLLLTLENQHTLRATLWVNCTVVLCCSTALTVDFKLHRPWVLTVNCKLQNEHSNEWILILCAQRLAINSHWCDIVHVAWNIITRKVSSSPPSRLSLAKWKCFSRLLCTSCCRCMCRSTASRSHPAPALIHLSAQRCYGEDNKIFIEMFALNVLGRKGWGYVSSNLMLAVPIEWGRNWKMCF